MYIDTADIEDIKRALKTGIIKGVTTNPTILKKGGKKRDIQIKDIVSLGIENIFVQVIGKNSIEMYEDYNNISKLGDTLGVKIGIKVPICLEGLEVISMIKKADPKVKILGTAIYSSDQGILAALAGCHFIAPYINRMQNNSTDPYREISKIRDFIEDRGLDTIILAASFKNTSQVVESLVSGAHTCTIPYEILTALANKDVAMKAIEVFNEDGEKTI